MKFVCLGYYNEAAFNQMSPEEQQASMECCLQYDDELKLGGHMLGGEALQSASQGACVRVQNGQVIVTDGPFIETKEQLGGLLFLEARDLNHAIQLISRHPGIHFGPFEIRPVDDDLTKYVEARSERLAAQKSS